MANIGETARRVFNTLIEFNRIEIPDLLRAKTVEKFRPPVEYITTNLLKYYVDVGLPLSSKGWKTASLARELQKELAISYKIIVERMISGDSGDFDRRLLVIALHRTLYYLGQSLLQNALVYTTWPEGIWREINCLYSYASQNRIHDCRATGRWQGCARQHDDRGYLQVTDAFRECDTASSAPEPRPPAVYPPSGLVAVHDHPDKGRWRHQSRSFQRRPMDRFGADAQLSAYPAPRQAHGRPRRARAAQAVAQRLRGGAMGQSWGPAIGKSCRHPPATAAADPRLESSTRPTLRTHQTQLRPARGRRTARHPR